MLEIQLTALLWRSASLWVILAGYHCFFGEEQALAAAVLTRGPYLQRGGTTNMVVRWRTDSPTASCVRYGTNLDAVPIEVTNSVVTTEHIVELFDLAPGTRYYYSVGTIDQRLAGGASFFFTTAPVITKPTKIWVIGDSGTQTPDQLAVRDAYKHFVGTEQTDLWLMLGDNAYSLGFDPVRGPAREYKALDNRVLAFAALLTRWSRFRFEYRTVGNARKRCAHPRKS